MTKKDFVLTSSNFNTFLKKKLDELRELLGNKQDGYKPVANTVLLDASRSLYEASRSTEITCAQRTKLREAMAMLHQAAKKALIASGQDTTSITKIEKAIAESDRLYVKETLPYLKDVSDLPEEEQLKYFEELGERATDPKVFKALTKALGKRPKASELLCSIKRQIIVKAMIPYLQSSAEVGSNTYAEALLSLSDCLGESVINEVNQYMQLYREYQD